MKKKELKNLSLNKKKISNLEPNQLQGGIDLPTINYDSLLCLTIGILTIFASCREKTCGCPSIP